MAEYKLEQLLDVEQVRRLLESHHRQSKMAYAIFDVREDNIIAVGWQEICARFHRKHPVCSEKCRESDAIKKLHQGEAPGDPIEYRCGNGMIELAIPIMIDRMHAATFFAGQFFYDDDRPDVDFFRNQADALGLNAGDYIEALRAVPVLSREHVRINVRVLYDMIMVLAQSWYNNLKLLREIEYRRRTERRLYQREEEFRAISENTPDTIVRYDRDCRRLYANRAFVEMAGVSTLDLLDKTPTSYSDTPGAIEYERRIKHVYQTGKVDEYEYTWPDRDGNPVTSLVRMVPERDLDGKIVSVSCCGRDITEDKEIQAGILKAQKLEALEVLASGIAHDFNNLGMGISGHIFMARQMIPVTHEAQAPLQIASEACLKAKSLTNRLATFAREDVLVKTTVCIRKLLNESLSLSQRKKSIRESIQIPDNLDDIEADEGQISQVFNNIIINGVHSMPNGGVLTIQAENASSGECELIGLSPGAFVKISFTDEGGGIREEDRHRVFDPFFTTEKCGAGLGLTSCHSIIKRHGGRIQVSSSPGAGATFTLFLPSLGNGRQQDPGVHPGLENIEYYGHHSNR